MPPEGQITPAEWRTERLELDQLTSDPANPQPGDEWLRVDQKPTYEDANDNSRTAVAEYRRVQENGTTITAPVAQLGDATAADVIDKIRTKVTKGGSPTGKGFIPYCLSTSIPSYPKRRLQHPVDGQVGLHDALTVSTIPNSGRLHLFDFRDSASLTLESGTIESISDQDTNTTLSTGAISGGLTEINGSQAAQFDGNDDYLEGNVGDLKPYDVHIVSQADTTGIGQAMFSGNNKNSDVRISNGNFQMIEEENLDGAPENTNANVVSSHFDGADSELIISGNSYTGDVAGGSEEHGLTQVVIGQGGNDVRQWGGAIAVVGVYDPTNDDYDRLEVHKDYRTIFGI